MSESPSLNRIMTSTALPLSEPDNSWLMSVNPGGGKKVKQMAGRNPTKNPKLRSKPQTQSGMEECEAGSKHTWTAHAGETNKGAETAITGAGKHRKQEVQEKKMTAKDYKIKASKQQAALMGLSQIVATAPPMPANARDTSRHLPTPRDTSRPPQSRASRCLPTSADPCHPLTMSPPTPAKCRRLPTPAIHS